MFFHIKFYEEGYSGHVSIFPTTMIACKVIILWNSKFILRLEGRLCLAILMIHHYLCLNQFWKITNQLANFTYCYVSTVRGHWDWGSWNFYLRMRNLWKFFVNFTFQKSCCKKSKLECNCCEWIFAFCFGSFSFIGHSLCSFDLGFGFSSLIVRMM